MLIGEPYILGVPPFTATDTTLLSTQANKSLDLDAFLKMFTTQLEHQDPLNPMESYELAAQLAQFSTVEQLMKANTYLKEGAAYLSSINNLEVIGLINKSVKGYTDLITVQDGIPVDLNFTLSERGLVTIYIYDESGRLVQSIDKGQLDAGTYPVGWDGCNMLGNKVSDGNYHIEIKVVNVKGQQQTIYPDAEGTVESVKFINGLPYLVLGDKGIVMPAGYITQVWDGDHQTDVITQTTETGNQVVGPTT